LWEGGENFSGVHPVYSFHSASFELRHGHRLGLDELFDNGQLPSSALDLVVEKLAAKYEAFSPETVYRSPELTRMAFTFGPDGVEFNFAPGSVAAYAAGPATITIEYDTIAADSRRLAPQGSLR
jgi:hypothetical protein